MIFGSLICKIRKYHKYSYYYSGECITCGKIRREHDKQNSKEELIQQHEAQQESVSEQ